MLSRWLESGTLQPCRILVPGCGRGHEVIALAEAGFDVTAVDFADDAVASLNKNLDLKQLSAMVVQSDLFAFEPTQPFDAVFEQTTLCAIDPSQWQAYAQLLTCWLRPGGTLMALFMQSDKPDGPPFTCDLQSMKQLFLTTDWTWCGATQRVEHPMGMHELACVLQRTENRT
jgi:cyclopropane fatty-acyl-phospholipid synthase-like methyltransferase